MERFNIIQGQVARPRVDFVNKIIHGVAVCAEGEAKGHSCFIGNEFLAKLAQLGNEKGKVMVHLGHYNQCSDADPLTTALGVCKNFTIDGACVRGDIHFLYLEKTKWLPAKASEPNASEPNKSINEHNDTIDKLLEFADQHPETFGLSIVFEVETEAVDNEFGETERLPKYLADPTGQDRTMVSIARFMGVDFVEFPAANEQLFSEFTEAGKATQALNRIKKNAPTLFQKVSTFAKKYFGLDVEQVETQKEVPQKTEQTQPTNKKMSILSNLFGFSKKKAEPTAKKFGEIAGDDGTMYSYEGEELMVGEALTIVDPTTGESVAAPAGEHIMADGTLVICDDMGMISSVTPPSANEVASEAIAEQLSANEVTKKQLAAARAALAAKDKQIAKINEAAKNAGIFTNTQTPTKLSNKLSFAELKTQIKQIKEMYAGKVPNMRFEDASLSEVIAANKERLGFATGADFIGSVATACKEYMTPELMQSIYTEATFMQNITDMTTNSPYNANNQLDVKLPIVGMSVLSAGAITAAVDGCPNLDDIPANVKAILSDKVMQFRPVQSKWEVCPNDQKWREVFNRLIFIDENTVPIEAVFMQLWIARIQRAIVELIVNGNSGFGVFATGAPLNGIVKQIADDILGTAIPSAQLFPAHTNWTVTNVKGFVDQAIDAIPIELEESASNGDMALKFFIARSVWKKYRRALEALGGFFINPYTMQGVFEAYVVTDVPVVFVVLESLNRTSGANDTGLYFIAPKERILHGHSDKTTLGSPRITLRETGKIHMMFEYYEGIAYPFANDFVTNIPSA